MKKSNNALPIIYLVIGTIAYICFVLSTLNTLNQVNREIKKIIYKHYNVELKD